MFLCVTLTFILMIDVLHLKTRRGQFYVIEKDTCVSFFFNNSDSLNIQQNLLHV